MIQKSILCQAAHKINEKIHVCRKLKWIKGNKCI